jgi:hypothetical protein
MSPRRLHPALPPRLSQPLRTKDSWGARTFCRKEVKLRDNSHPIMTWGASMTVLETVILALILVWAPGLMLGAYLTWGPRRVD